MHLVNLGPDVCIGFAAVQCVEAGQYEIAELGSLGEVAAKRRREFLSGRRLARALLAADGHAEAPILRGRDRLPVWPEGAIASISHTDSLVAVALARSPDILGLGLDIEQHHAAPTEIMEKVMVGSERLAAASGGAGLTNYFSAKEAAFKAAFPLHAEYFEFTDIEIEFDKQVFLARAISNIASADTLANGQGMVTSVEEHTVNVFVVRSSD